MRRSPIALLALIALAGWFAWQERTAPPRESPGQRLSTPARSPASRPVATPASTNAGDSLSRAIAAHASGADVTGSGTVVRVLRDDDDGSRHQRFLVDVGAGATVLIAHNIDLAPRVAALRVGDRVEFAGEFEWNERGGVVHWTHGDPRGRHREGYVRVVE